MGDKGGMVPEGVGVPEEIEERPEVLLPQPLHAPPFLAETRAVSVRIRQMAY